MSEDKEIEEEKKDLINEGSDEAVNEAVMNEEEIVDETEATTVAVEPIPSEEIEGQSTLEVNSDTNSQRLDLYIEALIFAADYALNAEEIRKVVNITFDQKLSKKHIEELIDNVREKYEDDNMAIQLMGIAGGYLFMTKTKYHRIIGDFLKLSSKKKLSRAALETLSIIAYKQPITKSEIESIRGVNADYAVQKLLEKELVEIFGRAEGPGRPLLYGTSTKFLNHFGLKNTAELPKLKEFETPEDTIGVSEEE